MPTPKPKKEKRAKKRTAAVVDYLGRNAVWWFSVFALSALLAFWPSYFSHPLQQSEIRLHTHGIAMSLWCAALIFQAYLIRKGLRQTHRMAGKASYLLVPFLVVATLNLVHFRMKPGAGQLTNLSLYFMALMLNAVVVFVLLYGLAMVFRREPATHARYMICTAFPLFTPVTDRLIFNYVPSVVGIVPVLDGSPMVQVIGFLLADLLLLALSVWDWKANNHKIVFPLALGVMVLYHLSVLTFYRLSVWRVFADWFLKLPLS